MIKRSAAVIVRDGRILLMHRIKNGEEYYSFPGGLVEDGETPEAAVVREIREEFTLGIIIEKFLFDMESMGKHGYYYLVTEYSGTPVLGGEEKALMERDPENRFSPEWKPMAEVRGLKNLYPEDVRLRIARILGV
jgi:ADP-ribose pyrophosphatase YjhB (NUDIX family)